METSTIEGEFLDRDSVQASVRRHLGLAADTHNFSPAEAGVTEMMVALYRGHDSPLDAETLHAWHRMVMNGRRNIDIIGDWRQHSEPMKVVSGTSHAPKVHFEAAPASTEMSREMAAFLAWFEGSGGCRR